MACEVDRLPESALQTKYPEMESEMPAKAKERDADWYKGQNDGGKSPDKADRPTNKFVRGELLSAEKEHLKSQQWDEAEVFANLCDLVQEGYRVSVSEDKYNNSIACWLTATAEDNPNKGLILPGRGPTVLTAMACCFYKHYTKFDAIWPQDDNQVQRDQWG